MKKLFIMSFLCLFLSSCGKMFKGEKQNVVLQTTDGRKANVIVTTSEGSKNMTLPASNFSVPYKGKKLTVEVKEDSCTFATAMNAKSNIDWVTVALDYLLVAASFTGFTATTIDVNNGTLWNYDETVMIPVTRKGTCPANY